VTISTDKKVVGREPVLALEATQAAAESAACDPRPPDLRIDGYLAHAREIDDDPAVARREAADAVTAGPHGRR
jgi:hypothetical protein